MQNKEVSPKPLTRKEILALPVEERRKILEKQANNPKVIAYYKSLFFSPAYRVDY